MNTEDQIINKVLELVYERHEAGMAEFGIPMHLKKQTTLEWLREAQEEAYDNLVYITAAIHQLEEDDVIK